jgi:hypothetical protein
MNKDILSIINPRFNIIDDDLAHIIDVHYEFDVKHRSFLMPLILSDKWPEAVTASRIVTTAEEQRIRANAIVNHTIHESLINMRFLDFGCGIGHAVGAAKVRGAMARGYDPKLLNTTQYTTTSNKSHIIKLGPYDTILVYDVIDHMSPNMIESSLLYLKANMHDKTKAYIRVHPFASRHGGHSYTTHNKAYIHMFLTPEEMAKNNVNIYKDNVVLNPREYYKDLFTKQGFKIISERVSHLKIESIIQKLIPYVAHHWSLQNMAFNPKAALDAMSIEFIDYIIQVL